MYAQVETSLGVETSGEHPELAVENAIRLFWLKPAGLRLPLRGRIDPQARHSWAEAPRGRSVTESLGV
jgi:hypothetical protein